MVQKLAIGSIPDLSVAKSLHFVVLIAHIKLLENIAFKIIWLANMAVFLNENSVLFFNWLFVLFFKIYF